MDPLDIPPQLIPRAEIPSSPRVWGDKEAEAAGLYDSPTKMASVPKGFELIEAPKASTRVASAALPNGFELIPAEDPMATAKAKLAEGLEAGITNEHEVRKAAAFRENALRPKANITDAAVNGATAGWADEAVAALTAPIDALSRGESLGEAYSNNLAEQNARLDEYRKRNPATAMAAEFAGGMASPVAALKVGGPIASAAATGAAYGGLYGAGNSEGGLKDRALGAVEGGAMGASAGAAASLLAKGIGSVLAPVRKNVAAAANPEGRAVDQLARDLARDKVTPSAAMAEIDAASAAGKPMSLGDLGGRNVMGLARAVATGKGAGSEKVNAFLEARKLDAPARILDDVRTSLANPEAFYPTLEGIIARRKQVAGPLYDAAYARPLKESPVINGVLSTPAGQDAIRSAAKLAENEGVKFGTNVQSLDLIKRSFDDMISAANRSGRGNEARIIDNLRKRMVSEIDRQVPEYKAARNAFSSETELAEAIERGRSLLKPGTDAERAVAEIRAMSGAEKDVARIGLAREIKAMFDDPSRSLSQANRLLNTERMKSILSEMFPGNAYDQFRGGLMREAAMLRRGQQVQGGSNTVNKAADAEDMNLGNAVSEFAQGRPIRAAISAIGAAGNRLAKGINERTADRLADMFTTTDPAKQREILRQIEQMLPPGGLENLLSRSSAIEAPQARSASGGQ